MKLSDWQLQRLRNALRAYHSYERSHEGEAFTWKDVSEAIDEYTGVRVPHERLRQFVEGVRQEDGGIRHPVPKGERLKAIYDFATNDELALLTEDEMTERQFDFQAALRLLEYLDQDFDTARIYPPAAVAGYYYFWREEPPFTCVIELLLSHPNETGVVQTHLIERRYAAADAPDMAAVAVSGLTDGYTSEARYAGWSILTPEDNFFLFLKEEGVGKNRYYFTVASDLDHSRPTPISNMSLLLHDYPLEASPEAVFTEGDGEPIEALISKNHQPFVRIKGV